ncbi:Casein kinase II subunit alpha [Nowakowskiella sp. JEL0407]|nr:Casein kinase II subunit alpha [Nowakowskiella sp. JEL0407]
MESIVTSAQNHPSPALGFFRKLVSALNHGSHGNSVSPADAKKLSLPSYPQNAIQSQYSQNQHYSSCCLSSITPCIHSANSSVKLAALASTSSFIPPPSRIHANVNVTAPVLYWDYERASLESMRTTSDRFKISGECIGSGRYSQVYPCTDAFAGTKSSVRHVVKLIRPGKSKRVRREVLILKNLENGPNIVKFKGFLTEPDSNQPGLVFEHVDSPSNWREMFLKFTDRDCKLYMYKLLAALKFAHEKGVMHRDVKPQNIMFDPKTKDLRLIDWGLAEFYFPYQKYSTRVASRFFKSPEILLGYAAYDYSLDVWSAGCLFAGMIFKTPVFFRGEDDIDQLNKIAEILGTHDLREYIRKFDMQRECNLAPDVDDLLRGLNYEKVELKSFFNEENQDLATSEAIEVLEKMLMYNHMQRWSAEELMACKYFDDVREC